jgi:LysM repeat protein
VTARPARMTLLALATAVIVGGAVGVLSQMTAVSVADPRPSTPPPSIAPTPQPTFRTSPSPAATPSATVQAQRPDVWRYPNAQGDSLSALAIRWGTTTGALLTLNPTYAENEDLVQAGSQVIMPCTPIAVAEKRC